MGELTTFDGQQPANRITSLAGDATRQMLIEHDEITLKLVADGTIEVCAGSIMVATIRGLGDLPGLVADPGRWTRLDELQRVRRSDFGRAQGTVLKADRDHDLYCVWSNNVDNVKAIGTAEQMLAQGVPISRLLRAYIYGTSARWPDMPPPYPDPFRADGWDNAGMVVHNQDGAGGGMWLPRARLLGFLQAKAAGDQSAALALLDPIEDDSEDRE